MPTLQLLQTTLYFPISQWLIDIEKKCGFTEGFLDDVENWSHGKPTTVAIRGDDLTIRVRTLFRKLAQAWWLMVRKYYGKMKIDGNCRIWCLYVPRHNNLVTELHSQGWKNHQKHSPMGKDLDRWKILDITVRPQLVGGVCSKESQSYQITEYTKVVWQPCKMIPYLHHDIVPKEVNSEEWLSTMHKPGSLAENLVRKNTMSTFTEKQMNDMRVEHGVNIGICNATIQAQQKMLDTIFRSTEIMMEEWGAAASE